MLQENVSLAQGVVTNGFLHRERVRIWQQPFPQIKQFLNGTVDPPSVPTKQALNGQGARMGPLIHSNKEKTCLE